MLWEFLNRRYLRVVYNSNTVKNKSPFHPDPWSPSFPIWTIPEIFDSTNRVVWLLCERHFAKDFVWKAHGRQQHSHQPWSTNKETCLRPEVNKQLAKSLMVIRDIKSILSEPLPIPPPNTHTHTPLNSMFYLHVVLFPLPSKPILHHSSTWLTWLFHINFRISFFI